MRQDGGFIVVQRIVNFIYATIVLLLGLRTVFAIFNASFTSQFAVWIYTITQPLVYPFVGMIPNIGVGSTGGTIDSAAIISLVAYSIVAYFIVTFFHSLTHSVVTHTHHETI